jgi:hypothetical protein
MAGTYSERVCGFICSGNYFIISLNILFWSNLATAMVCWLLAAQSDRSIIGLFIISSCFYLGQNMGWETSIDIPGYMHVLEVLQQKHIHGMHW